MMDKSHTSWTILRKINLVVILLFTILLTSCTHVAKKDGPPHFYVDETKVPDAVPKPEKLAKFGNMESYRVFGKRYYTMKSSRGYQAVGVASWYGMMFHARRTSSGERYDVLGMTAAHKTLPLPTYVEVTNLKNNRKVIVKVNDRGPFESNRLIDLSYVAAKKLGMLGHGTAMVKLKAIDPATYGKPIRIASNTPRAPKHHSSQRMALVQACYLQVGAYRKRIHAERMQKKLVAMLEAPVKISKGKLYRVKVGPIKDVATADEITTRLRGLGIKTNRI